MRPEAPKPITQDTSFCGFPDCHLSCRLCDQPPSPPSPDPTPSELQIFFDRDNKGNFLYNPNDYGYNLSQEVVGRVASAPAPAHTELAYRHLPLHPFTSANSLESAVDLYRESTLQPEPNGKKGQVSISKLERLLPRIYYTLGFETGTTHLDKAPSPQAEISAHFGSVVHTMALLMKLTARKAHLGNPRAALPTLSEPELEPLLYAYSQSTPDLTAPTLYHTWHTFADCLHGSDHPLAESLVLLRDDPQFSGRLDRLHSQLARFLAHAHTQPNPLPIYNPSLPVLFEPNLVLSLGSPGNMIVRIRPDQVTLHGRHVYVADTKTSHPLEFAGLTDPDLDSLTNSHNQAQREEILLRQVQLLLLGSYQLAAKARLFDHLADDAFRAPGEIFLKKLTLTPPQLRLCFLYETLTGRDPIASSAGITNQLDFSYPEWEEFFNWLPQFYRAYKLVSRKERDRAGTDHRQLGLLQPLLM